MKKSIILIMFTVFVVSGCDLIDKIKEFMGVTVPNATEEAVAVIDRGISELSVASADWQDVLTRVLEDLPENVQSTIETEVSELLQRGIATTGTELRCNVDFLRIRMRQGLERIKARIMGNELPPLEPHLCQVVPSAIDMSLNQNRRNKIEFFGYDFDRTEITVLLIEGNRQIDISRNLDRPSHYHMTLNLGSSGANLTARSSRIILKWGGEEISSIGIIQPEPNICQTDFDNFTTANVGLMPAHATKPGKSRGDKEFSGNGPYMYCQVKLINERTRLRAKVYVTASETKRDWTYGRGVRTYTIFTPDPGYEIEKVITPAVASYSYTDNDHAEDVFAGSGPVQYFKFNGDGPGSDIGRNTNVEIQFNEMRVQLKETGNCVSSAMLRNIQLQDAISPVLIRKMERTPQIRFIAPSEFELIDSLDH